MSDLKFNCPHCQQSLEAPEELLGQTINCPSCNGRIQLPSPQPRQPAKPLPPPQKKVVLNKPQTAPPPQTGRTKPCPFCGEQILEVAKKCKHCGSTASQSKKRLLPAFLLCFFFGVLGIHAFYVGKVSQGIVFLVLFFGAFALDAANSMLSELPVLLLFVCLFGDLFRLAVGAYKDTDGNKITQWI
jgi:uncharacterized protein (DUF983 family)/DNA-directed RNA polymerase subunit RPC12/RpoP